MTVPDWVADIEAVVVDIDGTVLRGGEVIPGAAEGIAAARAAGLQVLFLTNNPLRNPDEWARSLSERGIAAEPGDIVTSMDATLAYLEANHGGAAVLPIAGERIVTQVREAGFRIVDEPPAADLVLAGYHEGFDYGDLLTGLRAVRSGLPLVGTDPDRWVPTDAGPIPGSGAVVNAVAGAAEVDPTAVLGKPSPETAAILLDRLSVEPGKCLLVGDRLDTDVAMGEQASMRTALVLTGASDRPTDGDPTPDVVLESLGDLAELLGFSKED